MRGLAVLLALCLAFALSGGSALAGGDDLTGQVVSGIVFEAADGAAPELSALLGAKDAVVLIVFSPAKPPDEGELAMMDGVCRELSDRVALVAAVDGPGDGSGADGDWSAGRRLGIPVGTAADPGALPAVEDGPAVLILDGDGRVVYAQADLFVSATQFREIVDHFAGKGGDAAPLCAYTVLVRDQNGEPVPGAVVGFCDFACRNYTADAQGAVAFTGGPARYSLHVVSVPEGYGFDRGYEGVCVPGEWTVIQVVKE